MSPSDDSASKVVVRMPNRYAYFERSNDGTQKFELVRSAYDDGHVVDYVNAGKRIVRVSYALPDLRVGLTEHFDVETGVLLRSECNLPHMLAGAVVHYNKAGVEVKTEFRPPHYAAS